MKIDKITFKNNQAWVVIKDIEGNYLGTWHIVYPPLVEELRKVMPDTISWFRGKPK